MSFLDDVAGRTPSKSELTADEIIKHLAKLPPAEMSKVYSAAYDQNRLHEQKVQQERYEAEQKAKREKAKGKKAELLKLLKTAKFRKWREEAKELIEALRPFDSQDLTVKLNIPIEIKCKVTQGGWTEPEEIFDNACHEPDFPGFDFSVQNTEVTLLKGGDLSTRQRETLQEGIRQLQSNWCAMIVDMFDDQSKLQEKLQKKGQRLITQYDEWDLNGDYAYHHKGVEELLNDTDTLIADLEKDLAE